jgi:uncharacterized protein DUF4350
MRQKLTIILTFVVIIGLLAALNSIGYLQQDKTHDFEVAPNRSSYHSGPTGTRALHDFLNESGYKVVRWRDTTQKLRNDSGKLVKTFVVVGQIQVRFTEAEMEALGKWVAEGGRLVLIDRTFDPKSKDVLWNFSARQLEYPSFDIDPGDAKQMTDKVVALQPVQPTVLTRNVQSVLPSRFAARIRIVADNAKESRRSLSTQSEEDSATPALTTSSSTAPVVDIGDAEGALLLDYSYGLGKVVVLSDPYIVSNGGIKLNDNLQLALNMIATADGVIAFDEYHQGKGIMKNGFASYFAGTPVLLLAAQIGLLVLLILWTNARRFGRPLPLAQVDRRSSLEFVASMAELQERARSFDLAMENIYTRTRRVLARQAGVDYNSSRSEIASRIAARSSIDAHKLETLMRQCEEVINGEPVTWRQSVDLVRRLREVERDLGLRMRSRDARQAAENI